MVKVAGVRFRPAGRIYYFDPGDLDLESGDDVVVETARGVEYGILAYPMKEVEEEEITPPLKKVIRKADDEDRARQEAQESKREENMNACREKIEKHGLDMRLVDMEQSFDNSKIIFYFTSDGRVDFRELVKDLASTFRTRIELRQIGVRDEAKLCGGIGTCGRVLCCSSWLSEFHPVSIKMAKVQNLSLNPTKISGICGRLLCCLEYENEVYKHMRKGMPDQGDRVQTPEGEAIVCDVNILEDKIRTRLILEEDEDGKPSKLAADYETYGKESLERLEKRPRGQRKRAVIEPVATPELEADSVSETDAPQVRRPSKRRGGRRKNAGAADLLKAEEGSNSNPAEH